MPDPRDALPDDAGRHGRGIFDCPTDDCSVTIVGSYDDLFDHVHDDHPLEALVMDDDRQTILDHIRDAQKDALAEDIHEHMMATVSAETNQEAACGGSDA